VRVVAGIVISRCAYCDLTVVSLDLLGRSLELRALEPRSREDVHHVIAFENKTPKHTVAVKSRENEA